MDLGASEVRKISKTLALMGLFAPWGAYALGIGDIRLHSALNETLNAEIPLVTSNSDEISDIRVALASPEAFAHANIERNHQLTKLRFTPKKKADGSYVIKVTSKEAIREPFLDFMVEVHWPQGRVQREFTVLLDPPDSQQEASANPEELPESESYPFPANTQPSRGPSSTESQPNRRTRRSAIQEPRDTDSEIGGGKAEANNLPVTGAEYGPVGRNETLWSIATKSQHPSTSPRQMLVAIYKANPKAFYKPSIDALKAGATLTIPDQASVIRLADAAGIPHASGKPGNPKTRPKTVAAVDQPSTGAESPGQLQLLAPSESKSLAEPATSGKRGKASKTREDLTLEVAETAKQESENYRKRLTDLEQQLSAMQKLLALKDEQIASLQNQTKTKDGQPIAPNIASAQVNSSTPKLTVPLAPPLVAPVPVPPPPVANTASQKPNQPVVATPPQVTQSPVPPAPVAKPATPPPPSLASKPVDADRPNVPHQATGVPPVQTKPAISKQPEEEKGILSELLDNPYYLVGGATGLLLLALLWQFKRRRSAMIDNAESILTLTDKEKPQPSKQPVSEAVNVSPNLPEPPPAFRSSFLSEFTPSDFDALGGEMEEVDPISEADVYLAYGRYKQAEDLIVNAIAQNPERDECRLKLLEIHYATEDAQAFEKCAQELALTHKDTKPEFWEKVVEMGRELCAGNPLFMSEKPVSESGLGLFNKPIPELSAATSENDIYLFNQDDNIESYTYTPPPPASIPIDKKQEDNADESVAYDFFNTDDSTGINLAKESVSDFKLPDIKKGVSFEKDTDISTDEEIEIPDESMEEMLAKLGALSESEPLKKDAKDTAQAAGSGSKKEDSDIGHFEIDDVEQAYQIEVEETDVQSMDEMGSKLDLARAYFDLGDPGAARAILQHVAQHGESAQQEEAKSLLARLDSK